MLLRSTPQREKKGIKKNPQKEVKSVTQIYTNHTTERTKSELRITIPQHTGQNKYEEPRNTKNKANGEIKKDIEEKEDQQPPYPQAITY